MNTFRVKERVSLVVKLNEDDWSLLLNSFEILQLKKNGHFLKEGEICNTTAFVNSGALIYYKLLDNGKEVTVDFAFDGNWVTDNKSRLEEVPSLINIKAIADCELLVISNEKLNYCYKKIPQLEIYSRKLIEQAFIKIVQQSIDFQALNASQRYDKMVNKYPDIFHKIPLYHIANYLGVAPKSLSRIRKNGYKG